MKKLYLIGLALIAAMVIPSTVQAVPLTNPGFDADTNMPPTGWSVAGSYGGEVQSPAWARSSANVLKYWSSAGETYTFQDFSVVGNTPYIANIWAYAATGDVPENLEGYLKIEFPGYGTVGESAHFDGSTLDTWTQLTATATAPSAATTGRIVIVFGDLGDPNSGAIGFDDADVTAIPEPASLLLLGSGLVGLFSIARRKK